MDTKNISTSKTAWGAHTLCAAALVPSFIAANGIQLDPHTSAIVHGGCGLLAAAGYLLTLYGRFAVMGSNPLSVLGLVVIPKVVEALASAAESFPSPATPQVPVSSSALAPVGDSQFPVETPEASANA